VTDDATHDAPVDARGYWAMTLRVVDGRAEVRQGDAWQPAPLRILARHYPARSETWRWLRAQGVERPRVGGSTREADRSRGQVLLRLPEDALERLDTLAATWALSRSDTVVRLVREAPHKTRKRRQPAEG